MPERFCYFFISTIIALIPVCPGITEKKDHNNSESMLLCPKTTDLLEEMQSTRFVVVVVRFEFDFRTNMPGIRPVQANCIVRLYKSSRLISEL